MEKNAEASAREILAAEKNVRSLIMKAVERFPPTQEIITPTELKSYARGVFEAVFNTEIQMKLEMRDGYKGAKFKPVPLPHAQALALTTTAPPVSSSSSLLESQHVWPISKCAAVFEEAIVKMWSARRAELGSLSFDKDDELAMDFVTAASNLRCHVFGIERKSPFEVKGIAGNIIHAIATTNAIVAGLQVLEAIRVLNAMSCASPTPGKKITEDCRYTWVVRIPAGSGYLLQPVELEPPLATCAVCQRAQLFVSLDLEGFTLGDFIKKVLNKALGVNEPTVLLGSGILFETGSDLSKREVAEYARKSEVRLRELGVASGAEMVVNDFSQGDMQMNIILTHVEGGFDEKKVPEGFEVSGKRPNPNAKRVDTDNNSQARPDKAQVEVDADGCLVLEDDEDGEILIE